MKKRLIFILSPFFLLSCKKELKSDKNDVRIISSSNVILLSSNDMNPYNFRGTEALQDFVFIRDLAKRAEEGDQDSKEAMYNYMITNFNFTTSGLDEIYNSNSENLTYTDLIDEINDLEANSSSFRSYLSDIFYIVSMTNDKNYSDFYQMLINKESEILANNKTFFDGEEETLLTYASVLRCIGGELYQQNPNLPLPPGGNEYQTMMTGCALTKKIAKNNKPKAMRAVTGVAGSIGGAIRK